MYSVTHGADLPGGYLCLLYNNQPPPRPLQDMQVAFTQQQPETIWNNFFKEMKN